MTTLEHSPRRRPPVQDQDWEQHRHVVTDLYLHQGYTLKRVVSHMTLQYGFCATEQQYKRRFAAGKWNLQKYPKSGQQQPGEGSDEASSWPHHYSDPSASTTCPNPALAFGDNLDAFFTQQPEPFLPQPLGPIHQPGMLGTPYDSFHANGTVADSAAMTPLSAQICKPDAKHIADEQSIAPPLSLPCDLETRFLLVHWVCFLPPSFLFPSNSAGQQNARDRGSELA
jgi:Clr5 domain